MKKYIQTARLSIAVLAIGLLAACSRGPMPPTEKNFLKVTENLQDTAKDITAKEAEEGKASDEGKKNMMKKCLVSVFEDAGYDIDLTLEDYAVRMRTGNLTESEGVVIAAVMGIYGEAA